MGFCSTFWWVIATIFFPPLGVALITGCNADLLINVCLTVLGYFPGHIHAFYIGYIYNKRRAQAGVPYTHAAGIYSEKVQSGGHPAMVAQY
ncbi:MAG: hypothetical protein M1819_006898 [Sarea resinae]|nr:MAG: hypothetical protein M1819_006898 [Sarea resinae]